MSALLAVVVAGLYAAGTFLVMRRSATRLLIGLMLLGHATALLVFAAAGVERGAPPIAPDGATRLEAPFADPLPQALVLTAIVIGFGVQAFALVLLKRVVAATSTEDLEQLHATEEAP